MVEIKICSKPGEGKSTIAVAITIALEKLGLNIKLIDDDSVDSILYKKDNLKKFIAKLRNKDITISTLNHRNFSKEYLKGREIQMSAKGEVVTSKVCALEDDLIPSDQWKGLYSELPEECKRIVDSDEEQCVGIGKNEKLGWFVMGSGQGPCLLWSER